jgi:hypothetical protein
MAAPVERPVRVAVHPVPRADRQVRRVDQPAPRADRQEPRVGPQEARADQRVQQVARREAWADQPELLAVRPEAQRDRVATVAPPAALRRRWAAALQVVRLVPPGVPPARPAEAQTARERSRVVPLQAAAHRVAAAAVRKAQPELPELRALPVVPPAVRAEPMA